MKKIDWIWFGTSWMVLILLVNPIGEFPMNDDWGYAKVVKHLVETGEYRPGDWPVMTLFTQVLWGAAFAKIFGFSFSILRISTLTLAILGSLWVYRTSLLLSEDPFWGRMAFFTLAFSPLYFHLSFTFMTDVPFTVGVLTAVLLYRKAMEANSLWFWFGATGLVITSTLIRQPALLLAPAFGIVWVLQKPNCKRGLQALAGVLLAYGALLIYVNYLGEPGETPGEIQSLWPLIRRIRPSFLWHQLQTRGGLIAFNLAVFLLPLLILLIPGLLAKDGLKKMFPTAIIAMVLSFFLAYRSWEGVPQGNIIEFLGLGPTTLFGPERHSLAAEGIPPIFMTFLKVLGFLGLFIFIAFGCTKLLKTSHWKNWTGRQWWKLGSLFFLAAYGLYLLLEYSRFDRYQLVIVPVLILLLSTKRKRNYPSWIKIAGIGWVVAMGLFSVGGTKDYLAWNQTRWAVLDSLIKEERIDPKEIDGGLEFNGWYATAPQNPFAKYGKSWWFVAEDRYLLSFADKVGCVINRKSYPVKSWWPGKATLYLHERPLTQTSDTIFCNVETLTQDSSRLIGNRTNFTFSGVRNRSRLKAHSGEYAWLLTPEQAYAGTLQLSPVSPCDQITVSVWRWGGKRSAGIVIASPKSDAFHTFQEVFTDQEEANGWHRIRQEVRIPENYPFDKLDLYLWNPVQDSIWMDDLEIIWWRVREDRE